MSELPEHLLLRDIIIPGSHAANTYDLETPKLHIPFSRCQLLSIKVQLVCGVRYFDLRICQVDKKYIKEIGINE